MISKEELLRIAGEKQIEPTIIERDYALGWVLWGISQDSVFSEHLVFKGGTSLKKCWFEDYRFSEDLDFTAIKNIQGDNIKNSLGHIIDEVSEASNLHFKKEKTLVKQTLDIENKESYKATIYFSGPRGDLRNPLRIKFDITHYEKLILPPHKLEVMHPYSDADECKCKIKTYCIEEIIGEKLRALLQRSRPRDYYDIWYILHNKVNTVNRDDILRVFKEKAEYKNVPFDEVESLIGDDKYNAIEPHWNKQLDHQLTYAPKPKLIREEFNTLIKNLFEEEIPNLGDKVIQPEKYLSSPKALGIRERLIRAGKATRIINMIYDGSLHQVEPYSLRYKSGQEYFYGYNLSGGSSPPGIRSFLTAKIYSVKITDKKYKPRWPVEF